MTAHSHQELFYLTICFQNTLIKVNPKFAQPANQTKQTTRSLMLNVLRVHYEHLLTLLLSYCPLYNII